MVWLAPAALLGLTAVLLPIAIHLLWRRTARRVVVPTTRFVEEGQASATRVRPPADLPLLLVRMGIIAAAALALAQPLLITSGRERAAAATIARAVVVDNSASVAPDRTTAVVDAEAGAGVTRRFETTDPAAGIRQAMAWLSEAPPASREIVVLSDFQAGSVKSDDVARVAPDTGLRFVRLPSMARDGTYDAAVVADHRLLRGAVALEAGRTAVTYATGGVDWNGLRLQVQQSDALAVGPILETISEAGVHAPSPAQPIVVRFRGVDGPPGQPAGASDWTFRAGQRLLRDHAVPQGLQLSIVGNAWVVDADIDPSSLDAAELVAAVLEARVDHRALREHEPSMITDAELASWARPAQAPVDADWKRSKESDGRWLWVIVLVLLAAETWMRRRGPRASSAPEAHAL